jgi:hypothetical protein
MMIHMNVRRRQKTIRQPRTTALALQYELLGVCSKFSIDVVPKQECHAVSEFESVYVPRGSAANVQPRCPHREIAELLAMAIARARIKNLPDETAMGSEVRLGFSGDQRVNTNPSHTEGVRA